MQKYTPPELNSSRPHAGEMGWNLHALRVIAVTLRAFLVLRNCSNACLPALRGGTPWETPTDENDRGKRSSIEHRMRRFRNLRHSNILASV